MSSMKTLLVRLLMVVLLGCQVTATLENSVIKKIRNFVEHKQPLKKLYPLMDKGEMGGYFTHENFWQIYDRLHSEWPQFVGARQTLGQTFQKNKIEYFELGNEISKYFIA
jgi:hypothetical protein